MCHEIESLSQRGEGGVRLNHLNYPAWIRPSRVNFQDMRAPPYT